MAQATLNGIEIDYAVSGRGRPVILSHGYGATGRMRDGQRRTLGDRYRLITWDMRGHGQTESPNDGARYSTALTVADMRALLASLGVSRPVGGGRVHGEEDPGRSARGHRRSRPRLQPGSARGLRPRAAELPRLAAGLSPAPQPRGSPSTRSPMMLRWISLVPAEIVYCRAASTRLNQRGASGTVGEVWFTRTCRPRSSPAASAMRTPSSEPLSFSTDPSGPGGSPRSWRVRLRSRVYFSASDSMAS